MAEHRATVRRIGPAATTPDEADGSGSTSAPSASAWRPATPTASSRRRSRPCAATATEGKHLRRLAALVDELDVVEVVVGPATHPRRPDRAVGARRHRVADALAATHRPDPGAARRRTTDDRHRAAVAARGRCPGEGTEGDDRPGGRRRHPADLAGPAARASLANAGSGRCLTTGAASAPQPVAVGRPRRGDEPHRARLAPSAQPPQAPDRHRALRSCVLIVVVVIGAVFLGSRLWHGLFGTRQRLRGRRRQGRRRSRCTTATRRPRSARRCRTTTWSPRSTGLRRRRRGQRGDLGHPARLLQGAHRDSRRRCRRAACRSAEPGRPAGDSRGPPARRHRRREDQRGHRGHLLADLQRHVRGPRRRPAVRRTADDLRGRGGHRRRSRRWRSPSGRSTPSRRWATTTGASRA